MNDNQIGNRILVVDDEPDLLTLYELTLLREGYEVDVAASVSEAWQLLGETRYGVVISDMRLPDGTGLELMRRMEQAGRTEKVIVITAYGSAENAVEALKAGAFDYLTKPVEPKQFRSVVASATGRIAAAAPTSAGRPATVASTSPLSRLAGRSPAMRQVHEMVEKVARSMAPVLVNGESGTGKELVACAIHDVSARSGQPFVAVNCGAIPEHLLESEFFGYRKGAFTGANEDRGGFFQAAQGGTLFLDEIGDLPLAMQAKLLRVIQERSVRPVGSTQEQPLNVRIVSATHKDLAAEVVAGRFRQDLFYRLNVIGIQVPPLRDRLADLDDICRALLDRIARDAGVFPAPVLSPEARLRLARYPFPGNVRELENLLNRAVALSASELIEASDLGLPEQLFVHSVPGALGDLDASTEAPVPVQAAVPTTAEAALPADLAVYLDDVERVLLTRALKEHGFNRTAAGARLGLTLRQMRYRMARLGITEGGGDAEGTDV